MDPQNVVLPQAVQQLPKAKVFLKQSFDYYKNNFFLIATIFVFPFVLSLVQIFKIAPAQSALLSFFSTIIGFFATTAFLFVLTRTDDTKFDFASAYSGAFPYILPAFWVSILSTLAIIGGFGLLIIPGFMVAILLSFSSIIFFTENRRGLQALIKSWHYVKGNWWDVFGKYFYLGVIVAVPMIILLLVLSPLNEVVVNPITGSKEIAQSVYSELFLQLIISFVLTPLGLIYSLFIYKSLFLMKGEVSAEDSSVIKKKLIALAIIGPVLLIVVGIGFAVLFASLNRVRLHRLPAVGQAASVLSAVNPVLNFIK